MKKTAILPLIFFFGIMQGFSQITTGEIPYSWEKLPGLSYPVAELGNFSEDQNDSMDNVDTDLKPFRFANLIVSQLTPYNSGKWIDLDDGSLLWVTALHAAGAYSLNITFSGFSLGEGARLWIYNHSKTDFTGAVTSFNNHESGILATRPLAGDTLVVELLITHKNVCHQFTISRVGYDFTGIFGYSPKDGLFGNSGSCNIDIQCFEGNNWQTEKKSVCRLITSNIYLGSGALINNTSYDGTPYLLTANHVIMNQQRAANTVFFFNYESPSCHGPDGSSSQTISGSTLIATKYDMDGKLDFSLLQLSSAPPRNFQPYYAGWNRNEVLTGVATCIHHPSGDVKKISISEFVPVTDSYTGYDAQAFWKIAHWIAGTTEGGSSGSPLFDINHRIIGNLTGGEATCAYPYNDFYQKFSVSWNKYSDPSQQLAHWLDPAGTSAINIDGYDPYAQGTTWTDLVTLTNFNPNDHASLYLATDGGYLSGNNFFGDKAKAEFYDQSDYGYRTYIKGLFFYFGKATGNPYTNIQAAVWRQTSDLPSALLASANLNLGNIINNVAAEEYSYTEFAQPVLIPGPFYAGVYLPVNAGDTIALVTNAEGESSINTGWELNSDNVWLPYNSAQSWGIALANAVYPVVGRLISGIAVKPPQRYELSVFPNPSAGLAFVKIPEGSGWDHNCTLTLSDAAGKVISRQQAISGKEIFEISIDTPGFYIISLTGNGKFATGKLIISGS